MLLIFSTFSLVTIFIFSAIAVWIAGFQLATTTEIINKRFGFGHAAGGLIFLAITTNLPEIAIIISSAINKNIGIGIGNILGGISIQTIILVYLDRINAKHTYPLTYEAASLQLVLAATLVIAILVIVLMATQLPKTFMLGYFSPMDILIVITWVFGVYLINESHKGLPWYSDGRAPDTVHPKKLYIETAIEKMQNFGSYRLLLIFLVGSTITLIAGVLLEETGSIIADRIHWSGVLFGSTILAFVTALPAISTATISIKLRDYNLALSDIFGGNAFLPVLFLPATFFYGQSVLAYAQNSDIYLTSLGMLLTTIYIFGLIFRSKKQIFKIGVDSLIALVVYVLGIFGLFFIAK